MYFLQIQEAEAPNENGHFDRGLQNRAKDAIIEAPNDPEEKELPDKNLNEDEDQEVCTIWSFYVKFLNKILNFRL